MNMFTLARNFDNLDHKGIAQWVAENHPDVFLDAAAKNIPHDAWIAELPALYKPSPFMSGNAVAAIKHVRTHAGMGLKEAKWVVDCLRGITNRYELNDEETKVYDQIVAAGVTSL